MQLILFILSNAALVWILQRSPLFKKFREFITGKLQGSIDEEKGELHRLFYWSGTQINGCAGCAGFWSGIIIYCLSGAAISVFDVFQHGLIGSISALFIIQMHIKLN
jgi:hypothetical protein